VHRHEPPELENPEQVRGALRLLDALERARAISADDASLWRVAISCRAIFRRYPGTTPTETVPRRRAG